MELCTRKRLQGLCLPSHAGALSHARWQEAGRSNATRAATNRKQPTALPFSDSFQTHADLPTFFSYVIARPPCVETRWGPPRSHKKTPTRPPCVCVVVLAGRWCEGRLRGNDRVRDALVRVARGTAYGTTPAAFAAVLQPNFSSLRWLCLHWGALT